jgi:hypothetical protein
MLVVRGVVVCSGVLAGLVLSLNRSMARFFGLFALPFCPGRTLRATLNVAVVLTLLLALADRPLAAQTVTSSPAVGTQPFAMALNPVTNPGLCR